LIFDRNSQVCCHKGMEGDSENQGWTTVEGSSRLTMVVLRHIGAPFISFGVSCCVFLASCRFISGPIGAIALCTVIGFAGVFSGTLFLPRFSRKAGSFILLLLGMVFFYYLTKAMDSGDDP